MGQKYAKPQQDKLGSVYEQFKSGGIDVEFGATGMQGLRGNMEDAHCLKMNMIGHQNWSLFAVFDGHAGVKTAQFVEHALAAQLEEETKKIDDMSYKENEIKEAITKAFINTDIKLREHIGTDYEEEQSGATCVALIMTQKHFIFANCGDSRAIVAQKTADVDELEVSFTTRDQKPNMEVERRRITKANGFVTHKGRINGTLAVARAFGDFEYKEEDLKPEEQMVSVVPVIDIVERDNSKDVFIALCCDGVFDVFANETLATFVNSQFKLRTELDKLAGEVCDTALYKGSGDNMTACIIKFPKNAVKIDPKSQAKEKELETILDEELAKMHEEEKLWEQRRSAICSKLGENERVKPILDTVLRGGGIASKQTLVVKILDEKYKQPKEEETTEDPLNGGEGKIAM